MKISTTNDLNAFLIETARQKREMIEPRQREISVLREQVQRTNALIRVMEAEISAITETADRDDAMAAPDFEAESADLPSIFRKPREVAA